MGNKDNFTPEEKHHMLLNGAKHMICNYDLDYDSSCMDEFLDSMIPNISKNMDFMDWFYFEIGKWFEEDETDCD